MVQSRNRSPSAQEIFAKSSNVCAGTHSSRLGETSADRSPLAYWRRLPLRDFEPSHIEDLRDRLLELFLDRGLAYAGDYEDPAIAVRAAVAIITSDDAPDELAEDIAMSRLLCCALRGDRACAWILAGALDRRGRTDVRCRRLSEGWRRLAQARCRGIETL